MKRILSLLLIASLLLTSTICSATAQTEIIKDKNEIISFSNTLDESSSYADLWRCYDSIQKYTGYRQDTALMQIRRDLMELMLLGYWGQGEIYIKNYCYYNDYNNTNLVSSLGIGIPTSKESGQSYYYYKEPTDEGLIIGYESIITGDQTDNFRINFRETEIVVYSFVENKTYNMRRSTTYTPPALKDNAKNAYIYIANVLTDFYNPSSVVIKACEYNAHAESCYVTISAANRVGGTLTKSYWISKLNGSYTMMEWPYDITSNVYIKELNQKLQEYINRAYD